ncbi:glycosyltransferase [Catalinimonas alkaloidigena]|uniref:glycosyltransferase n=1 Tax=Catalinimonas alkaloidigena TaxID=1075417 RepID=UPI0024067B4F|nr:glycosyltransferase [Catalinimonas alkaloidigena]
MSPYRKKKLLIVSISAPPKNAPESLQAAKYFKYLSYEDFNTTLITSKISDGWRPNDDTLKPYLKNIHKVIEIPIWPNRYIHALTSLLCPFLLEKPDGDAPFHWRYQQVKKKLKNDEPDIIYSRSTPISSSILALKLKMNYKVPWVMHLSDPWVDNPYLNLKKKGKSYNKKKESLCFKYADRVTVTSKKTLELYQEKYPEHTDKLLLYPNVYDPDLLNEIDLTLNEKLTFVHTGRLYESRNVKSMLSAIEKFISRNPAAQGHVDFIFAGFADEKNKQIMTNCSLGCVKYLGALPFDKSLYLQRSAHVLINIDSDEQDSRFQLFFPSKLLDYFVAKKTMLCITAEGSTTYDLIEDKYGRCFTHDDIEGLADYITVCYEKFVLGDKQFFYNADVPTEFSASVNGKRLSTLLKEL